MRILGGTCLARELANIPGIELPPAGAEDAATFLRTLDCFIYRTSERWFEAYGRVVMEAMATGLPVVVSRRGGYADHLRDGANALLFDSTAEAVQRVLAVRADEALGARLARDARRTALRVNVDGLPGRTRALLGGAVYEAAAVTAPLAA